MLYVRAGDCVTTWSSVRLLCGCVLLLTSCSGYIPIEWADRAWDNDQFRAYVPLQFQEGERLVALQGIDEVYTIDLGTSESQQVPIMIAAGRRALYSITNADQPSFRLQLELLPGGTFEDTSVVYLSRLRSFEQDGGTYAAGEYRGHVYGMFVRDDLSEQGLADKSTYAIASILFPDENIITTIFFFAWRGNAPRILPVESIIKQSIDSSY